MLEIILKFLLKIVKIMKEDFGYDFNVVLDKKRIREKQ